jgi:hypothetical protein
VDVKGYRVYVCCPGCKSKIKASPEKYIEKIKENDETPLKVAWLKDKKCDGEPAANKGDQKKCPKGAAENRNARQKAGEKACCGASNA